MSKTNGTRLVLMAAIPTAILTLAVIGFNSRGIWTNDVALGRVDERVKAIERTLGEMRDDVKAILKEVKTTP